jgi:predicted RND superfamily exporter protein
LLAAFDAVIWIGGDELNPEQMTAAKRLIDAREIFSKSVRPTLVEGQFPDVEGSGALQVVYTGVIPVVYKAQRTLLHSLANSIGLAFVLIAAVMVVLLNPGTSVFDRLRPANVGNGLAAGIVSMIPNLFPVLLVFGVMCHRGVRIDIGTMMTASVAMGVAVDDTIHFLSWFRANLDRGMSRVDAVIETYRRVGPAMTQTTIVGGLGLFVFALSTFTPTQRFGMLMLVMLAAALVGDLILLPALLAGPAGRWFKPRIRTDAGPVDRASHSDQEIDDVGDHPESSATNDIDGDREIEKETVPQLRVHFPADRPPARRLK